jgi:hypothetical protein
MAMSNVYAMMDGMGISAQTKINNETATIET